MSTISNRINWKFQTGMLTPHDQIKMDKDKFIEWHFRLKPNQEITVPLKFYIEAPVGVGISGLEAAG